MYRLCRMCVIAICVSTSVAAPAKAQSFLEKLFGFGTPRTELPPPMPSYRAPIRVPPSRTYTSRSDVESQSYRAGKVRTVCVRLCDGYYFPLSHATSARNLMAENDRCKARCGGEARLFYSDSGDDPDPASMVDLTGRRYDALETAFAYRKALRPGCGCRPAPWSSSERLRHFKYALDEAQAEMKALAATELESRTASTAKAPAAEGDPTATVASAEPAAGPVESAADHDRAALFTEARHEPAKSGPRAVADRESRPLARQRAASARQRYSTTSAPSGLGGFLGFGKGQKYVWPGDAH